MLNNSWHKQAHGFTIVELLIVIVVIGILAAIVIVAYNGIQTSARNQSRISTLNQLQKAIELYYAENGRYPQIAHGLGSESSCGSQTENWGHCDRTKELTDALAPHAKFDPEQLTSATQGNRYFTYDSQSGDNWQTYGLMVYVDGDAGANDGGYFSNAYEVGQNPRYCATAYTGTGRDWLNTSGFYDQRCLGGN
jgi:prepilin-type N-terminal cleavage/methylation domain-containing protein